jgi:hypothetical protein
VEFPVVLESPASEDIAVLLANEYARNCAPSSFGAVRANSRARLRRDGLVLARYARAMPWRDILVMLILAVLLAAACAFGFWAATLLAR